MWPSTLRISIWHHSSHVLIIHFNVLFNHPDIPGTLVGSDTFGGRAMGRKLETSLRHFHFSSHLPFSDWPNKIRNRDLKQITGCRIFSWHYVVTSVDSYYSHTSYTKLLQETGLVPLNIRRKYFGLYKINLQWSHAAVFLWTSTSTLVRDINPYATRNIKKFRIPFANKCYVTRTFFRSVPMEYSRRFSTWVLNLSSDDS